MRKLDHIACCLFLAALVAGCSSGTGSPGQTIDSQQQRLFVLKEITPEKALAYLDALSLDIVKSRPRSQALLLTGRADALAKADAILTLVDAEDEYVVEILGPVSAARRIPPNEQIAEALEDLAIGTFNHLPPAGHDARGIIDVHANSVVAVIPVRYRREIVAIVALGPEGVRHIRGTEATGVRDQTGGGEVDVRSAWLEADTPATTDAPRAVGARGPASAELQPTSDAATEPVKQLSEQRLQQADAGSAAAQPSAGRPHGISEAQVEAAWVQAEAAASEIIITPSIRTDAPSSTATYETVLFENGDDTLVLNLPERLELSLLLDLAAEYLRLDYIYNPTDIAGQSVTLKLRGKLDGRMTVKELYPLLESVLRFKGFVMTRQEGNLVTVVPGDNALAVDPTLIGPEARSIRAGDVVVTRIFELQHLTASGGLNLLRNMKLGVSISPVEETQTLIVTCYASRMARIEHLLQLIDRPGRRKVARFLALRYITAHMLAQRIEAMTEELKIAGVDIALATGGSAVATGPPQSFPMPQATRPASNETNTRPTRQNHGVFLDADGRTNRICMVGYEEQLETVVQLIGAFDVPQRDLRALQIYELASIEAVSAKTKLEELGIIGKAEALQKTRPTAPTPQAKPSSFGSTKDSATSEGQLVEEPSVVVLEATNALLVNATREQHHALSEVVRYLDRTEEDVRTTQVYDIQHVDAKDALQKLIELGLCYSSNGAENRVRLARSPAPGQAATSATVSPAARSSSLQAWEGLPFRRSKIVVLEATNSLLVSATVEHHKKIALILQSIDSAMRREQIPYRIYPLENSSPQHLATVLQSLIKETRPDEDKEGKIVESAARRDIEDEITIVPDPNTYSLIVYASKKNQDWISDLVEQLDKRRPQVLIDVTLVEITETDSFNYELSLVRSWDDLSSTSGVSGVDPNGDAMGTLLKSTGGSLTAFYGDSQIQALLTAVQSKNYGRVLAKPKILVNDNEAGTIKTTDTTYIETKKSIPITSGGVGSQQNLIETSLEYEPYEAGIMLDITPHISEGDLLRLDLLLTRSDFLPTEDQEKPPNTTASEVGTAVTVPDGSTIILGGLLKLNQNKGGKKIPLLGDVPLVGGLFRSINNSDKQSKLYVFVKAEIIRPAEQGDNGMEELERISDRNRAAFEKHELEFQSHQNWPGVTPRPVAPRKVLDAD